MPCCACCWKRRENRSAASGFWTWSGVTRRFRPRARWIRTSPPCARRSRRTRRNRAGSKRCMGWGIAWRWRSGELLQFHDNTVEKNRHYGVMKFKTAGIILVWLASAGCACASTNDITTLVQKGLFEEEANHHLEAAIEYYQEAIGHFDKDRQLTATAIFRLGECYRLQGKTNEANVQYERIIREFSDQTQLVELSRAYLPKTTHSGSFVPQLTRLSEGKDVQSPAEQLEIGRIKDVIQNSPDLINATPAGEDSRLVTAARAGWM